MNPLVVIIAAAGICMSSRAGQPLCGVTMWTDQIKHILTTVIGVATSIAPVMAEGQLQISVSSKHTRIYVYEGLPIDVVMTNVGDEQIKVAVDLFKEERTGTIVIRDPVGSAEFVTRPQYRGRTTWGIEYQVLAPGKSVTVSFLLCCDYSLPEGGSLFENPGKYDITALYQHEDLHAVSAPLEIEVFSAPDSERQALQLVRNLREPQTLYEPDRVCCDPDEVAAKMGALRDIASVQQSTVYANYARYSLAWRHFMIAVMALSDSNLDDVDQEIKAAEELLQAIKTDGFTLAASVEKLRQDLEALKQHRAAANKARD